MKTARILEALNHQRNSHLGEFSDEDVRLLRDYWLHMLELTVGIPSLTVISIYAATEYTSAEGTFNARRMS